jgi:hypothetical protein
MPLDEDWMKHTTKPAEKKRRVVAAGAIFGAAAKEIAKAAGCSERHVNRLAAQPETQFLIAKALEPYHAELRLMAKRAVAAVKRGMTAQKKTKADHFTQLRAVERFGDLMELAGTGQKNDVLAKSGKGRLLVTWEQFVEIGKGRKADA